MAGKGRGRVLFVPYNRLLAVSYAHRWAYDRNPRFYDYEQIGGDCTNFASQCLFAGTGVMNFLPTFGWYYRDANDKSPSWTGVTYFYNFLIDRNIRTGPFGIETDLFGVEPGDFVQLELSGDTVYDHTPIIVERGAVPTLDNVLVAAHSQDADFRPLSTYYFTQIRFLHVLGAWHPRWHPEPFSFV